MFDRFSFLWQCSAVATALLLALWTVQMSKSGPGSLGRLCAWRREPRGQRWIVPMPRSPSQFAQTFQLCLIGPASVHSTCLARNTAILDPTRFHPIVERCATDLQFLNQLRCQPFIGPEKLLQRPTR